MLRENIGTLKQIFQELGCGSVYPKISQLDFVDMCVKAKMTHKQHLPATSLDRFFIASKFDESVKQENGINRLQFLEAIVRLADSRFRQSDDCSNYADAV